MKKFTRAAKLAAITAALGAGLVGASARADEVLKLGLSVPLSGPGANWGKGGELLCHKASEELKAAGGIKVKDKVYNIECIAYDNKYTSADGTRVAQTLINREGVKYLYVFGTPPLLAAQSITERQGVLLFNATWALAAKGPNFPLTFSVTNSPFEMAAPMVSYITSTFPQVQNVVLLNVNDASGKDAERVLRSNLEAKGVKVAASDFFERGVTEFQPIAVRLFAQKPDAVILGSIPPANAGQVFKELETLGFKGIKVLANGDSVDGILATAGQAVNGIYMGGAIPLDGPGATEHQRKLNEEARKALGESLGFSNIPGYDIVYMLKAAMEKAQSIDPKELAAVMPTVKFKSFYGGETGFGGKAIYGSVQQAAYPVYITQVVDGKLVEKARILPKE